MIKSNLQGAALAFSKAYSSLGFLQLNCQFRYSRNLERNLMVMVALCYYNHHTLEHLDPSTLHNMGLTVVETCNHLEALTFVDRIKVVQPTSISSHESSIIWPPPFSAPFDSAPNFWQVQVITHRFLV